MGGGIIHGENALAGVQQYIIKCEASAVHVNCILKCIGGCKTLIFAMILKRLSLLLSHS